MADTSGLDLDENVMVIQLFLSCLKLELSRLVCGGKSFDLVRHDDRVKMKKKNYPRTRKLFLIVCETCIYCHDLSRMGFLLA
jgi:thioredoxin-related protein